MDICPNRDNPRAFSLPNDLQIFKKTMSNYAKRNISLDDNETALNELKSYSVLQFAATKCLFATTATEADTPTAPDTLG